MMSALLENYGNRIRFDGKEITLWPRPVDLARVPPDDLKSKAKVGYRAGRLVRAAQYLVRDPISLADLASLPEQEALARLRRIPGVGEYSAGIIYGRTSVPLDVWSVVIMSELLLGRTPESPRGEIESVTRKVKERWGKWGWLAFVYVLNDLENLAKTYHLTRLQ